MRRVVRGVALAVGGLFVCLALALAALAMYGGASAQTAAPPGPGPRADQGEKTVSSPVESSPELPSAADSSEMGSGALAGYGEEAESNNPQVEGGAPESESPGQPPEDLGREPRGEAGDEDPDEAAQASDSSSEDSGTESASRPSLGSSEDVALSPHAADVEAPEDKTMRLTVPAMARVEGTEVIDAAFDNRSALDASALHPEGTGFPWEKQANVYIAGHRLGYPGTGSFLIFRDLNALTPGDAIFLSDAKGREYRYEVYQKEVIEPGQTSVMEEKEGGNIVTLQTCTLPDYTQRLIVRAAKVGG